MDDALAATVTALLPATGCRKSAAVRQAALSLLQALTCLPYMRLHLHKREVCGWLVSQCAVNVVNTRKEKKKCIACCVVHTLLY